MGSRTVRIASIAVAALAMACGAPIDVEGTERLDERADSAPALRRGPNGELRVYGSDGRVRRIGRLAVGADHAIGLAWSASAIELRVRGATSVRLEIYDSPTRAEDDNQLAVSIDGGPWVPLELDARDHWYFIAPGLSPALHRIEIAKRTELAVGTVWVKTIELSPGAELLEPRPRERRIEAFGDSITAGYGSESSFSPGSSCGFDADQENALNTYAAVAARMLGADYVATAWSGRGVVHNYDPTERTTFGAIVEFILPRDESREFLLEETQVADVVVFNLGTNDFARGRPTSEAFISEYTSLLERARRRHPGALIVVVMSPMVRDASFFPDRTVLRTWLQTAIARRALVGDRATLFIEQQAGLLGDTGCGGHPSARAHARYGAELANAVRFRLGW